MSRVDGNSCRKYVAGTLAMTAATMLPAQHVGRYTPGETFVNGISVKAEDDAAPDATVAGQHEGEMVFLLHGIGKGRLDMAAMSAGLRKQGYAVVNWGYPSTKYDLETLADKLAEELGRFPGYRIHFVTHSMGGIVVRTCMARHDLPNVGRMVMIAPPNQGAELAQFFGNWPVYRFLFGPAGQQLRPADLGQCASAGMPVCEFGIIAGGTGGSRGMNPFLPGDNDGTVTVESTLLPDAQDFAVVPYPHPVIQMMPRTIDLTVRFLNEGRFGVAGE